MYSIRVQLQRILRCEVAYRVSGRMFSERLVAHIDMDCASSNKNRVDNNNNEEVEYEYDVDEFESASGITAEELLGASIYYISQTAA